MPRRAHRHCLHCGRPLAVDPRVGAKQHYCARPGCAHASRLAAQRKWRRSPKGRDYFQGQVNGYQVREWRALHPGYWRQRASFGRALAAALRVGQMDVAHEDFMAFWLGLADRLSHLALQDTMAADIRRLILRGHAILRQRGAGDRSRNQ